jgi:hypothetical protein
LCDDISSITPAYALLSRTLDLIQPLVSAFILIDQQLGGA